MKLHWRVPNAASHLSLPLSPCLPPRISTKDIPRLDLSASSDSLRKFRRNFLNMLCATTTTHGFSVSEHLVGTDQGGPEGDPFDGTASEQRGQKAAFKARKLKDWGLLMSALECHPLLKESLLTLWPDRDSHLAWLYVEKRFDTPDTNSEVWRLKEEWLMISITEDTANNTKTVYTLGLLLSVVNAQLPPRSRYSDCEADPLPDHKSLRSSEPGRRTRTQRPHRAPHLHAAADRAGPDLDEGPAPRDPVLRRPLGSGISGRIYCKDFAF